MHLYPILSQYLTNFANASPLNTISYFTVYFGGILLAFYLDSTVGSGQEMSGRAMGRDGDRERESESEGEREGDR